MPQYPRSTIFPVGYGELSGPEFDDKVHLALERPTRRVTLDALGNDEQSIRELATPFAQTNAFRVMSDEGASVLAQELKRIEGFAVASPRIPRVLRGTTFRSRFIRGLCHSKAVLDFVSDVAGIELIPHPMEIQNGHVNLAPPDLTVAVDKWHYDTTPFILLIFCTPPEKYEGGEFEYFFGPVHEAEAILKGEKESDGDTKRRKTEDGSAAKTNTLPADRCHTVGKQMLGSGVFQQGMSVMHRARRLTAGQERTTLVLSFAPIPVMGVREACTKLALTYNAVDPLHVLLPDWARYRSWRSACLLNTWIEHARKDDQLVSCAEQARRNLAACVEQLPYTPERAIICKELFQAVAELRDAVAAASKEDHANLKVALINEAIACIDAAAEDVMTLQTPTMVYF